MLSAHALSQPQRIGGFTLIELMVVLSIIAIMAALAAPTLGQQLANFRVRSAADSIVTGLNTARAEAARRNSVVSLTLNTNGEGWTVAQVSPATTIRSRGNGEPSTLTITSSTSSRTVTFRPTGVVDTTVTPRLERINIESTLAATNKRQINILGGGLIRMCDPTVTTTGDARAC